MSQENVDVARKALDAFNRRDRAIWLTLSDKASGASVTWSYWQVVTFRDGKLLRMEWFVNRAEALEAVGLRE